MHDEWHRKALAGVIFLIRAYYIQFAADLEILKHEERYGPVAGLTRAYFCPFIRAVAYFLLADLEKAARTREEGARKSHMDDFNRLMGQVRDSHRVFNERRTEALRELFARRDSAGGACRRD